MPKSQQKNRNWVMILSAAVSISLSLWGIAANESFADTASALMAALKANYSWLYLGVMLFFVLFAVALALSPWGRIRLGADGEKPGYSTLSWFAMLFGTGMGIGLVFWSVAEPLSHYISPMAGIAPQSAEARAFAMRSCFMHWGIHPWACYAAMGLSLAYFQFRKGKQALISSLLKPLWGEKGAARFANGAVDVYTIVLTALGVATSFGMGCLQIAEGLQQLWGIPSRTLTWIFIIALIAAVYLRSAITGVDRGIRRLSDINLVLFAGLMLLGFLVGPMGETLKLGFRGATEYLLHFFPDSLRMSAEGDSTWIQNWRVYYWAWWLSWAPFVGIFIARISRGRTIREFVFGVMVIPTLVSVLWFSVFGSMALRIADSFTTPVLAAMVASPETALFHIFALYPLGWLLSLVAMALLVTFFITSANSATFVLAMLSSRGALEPHSSKKLFWGILIAVAAFALILTGGIQMIQTVSIVIAFPFLFLLLIICLSLVKALKKEQSPQG